MLLLSVYDKESKNYDQCFTKHSKAEATREFILACRNPQVMYNQFPEQFELHLLATISSEGEIEKAQETIITAEQVIQMDIIQQKNQDIPAS